MIKAYYQLTKPGVLFGNVISAVAGFLLASSIHPNAYLFLIFAVGLTLVIASACVINNYLDRDIDSKMTRTKKRPSVTGIVKAKNVIIFGIILGILGFFTLVLFTNFLTVLIGVLGFVTYVWLYGALSKRLSVHGTLVGSISGAMPILAGYVVVRDAIDVGAILVFIVLFFWQLPEFYSISVYRRDEYKAAGVPVISVVNGIEHTKKEILFYTFACVISMLLLSIFHYTGKIYFVIILLLGIYWIWIGFSGIKAKDNNRWGRKMFHFSLIILIVFCIMISINPYLW